MPSVRVTMSHLASELGVSISTISNAYNRPEKLSADTRRRVMTLAAELEYSGPDPLARSLRRQRTGGIGVVFTDELPFVFSDPASSGFLTGVAAGLAKTGQHLVLLPAGTPDRRSRAPIDDAMVDGIILHSLPRGEATLALVQRRGTPAVLVDQPGPTAGVAWVGLDETAAMRSVGEHLAALGHVHVGCITSRLGSVPHDGPAAPSRIARSRFTIPRDRIRGLEAGLGRPVIVEERWETSVPAGINATHALLARNPQLTAIACIADTYAFGVLAWAKQHHLRVPGQMMVTGFDDVPAANPAGLTTVRQPFAEKGRAAVDALFRTLVGEERVRPQRLPTALVVRASSGPSHG